MSASHGVGATRTVRQGAKNVVHSFLLKSNVVGANIIELLQIPGTTKKPVCFRVTAIVGTPYTNTGVTTLSVGRTGAAYTDVLSAVDAKAAAGTVYSPVAANGIEYVETTATIKAVLTVTTADGPGRIIVNIELWDVNVTAP